MKKQLYLFTFMMTLISSTYAFDERSFFNEADEVAKWQFIENTFITKIAADKKSIWTHFSSAATLALAGTAGYAWTQTPATETKIDLLKTNTLLALVTAAATGLLTIQGLECYLSHEANRNAVAEFFGNWDENQFYIPTELEEAFDMISEMIELEGKDAISAHANEIVELIQFHVTRHFEKRYEKVLQGAASVSLADAKTATEIIKLFTDTSKNIAGGK